MIIIKPQNAASTTISVVAAATPLFSLVNTAGSVYNSQSYLEDRSNQGPANGIIITPEDGNIRLGYGITPTAALGMLLVQGVKYCIPNIDISQIKLIRVLGNVKCSVDFGKCDAFEKFSAVAEAAGGSSSSSSGGVSGGGLTTYMFTPLNSFGHGTSAYASGTSFTVSGHSFTPEAVALLKVDRFNSSGVFQETLLPAHSTITASTTAGVTTYTYAAGAFSAGDLFVVYQEGPERTVTNSTDSARIEEINPLSLQFIEESLVDTTNQAASQAYFPSSSGMAMAGYKNFSITGKYIDGDITTTTFLVQGTNDEDVANADWVNLQGYLSGCSGTLNVASGTVTPSLVTALAQTSTFAWDFDNCNYRYIRVGVLPGDATNTLIIKARRSY